MINFRKLQDALDAQLWDDIDSDPIIKDLLSKLRPLYQQKQTNMFDEELNKTIIDIEKQLSNYKQKYTARGLKIRRANTLEELELTEEEAQNLIAWFEENFVLEDEDLEP